MGGPMSYRPQEIAERLGISASTLRLWSTQFSGCLSDSARKVPVNGALVVAQRRYTDEDFFVLVRAKDMLRRGQTYEEVNRALATQMVVNAPRPGPFAMPTQLPTQMERREPVEEHGPSGTESSFQEALEAKETVIASLKESLEAKDKTISALRESLAFLDIYIHTLRQEREDGRDRELQLEKELEELRENALDLATELAVPAWKRALAGLFGRK
jgi:DNA-binding transcriptional MerR regulator